MALHTPITAPAAASRLRPCHGPAEMARRAAGVPPAPAPALRWLP